MIHQNEIEIKKFSEIHAKKLKKTSAELTKDEKFSPSGYWKMKKSVSPGVNTTNIMSVMREDKVEVFGEYAIRNEYRKEFEKRLRNRVPDVEWEGYTKNTNNLLESFLNSENEEGSKFTMVELKAAIAKLKKGAPGIDGLPAELFINAGDGMLDALLFILNEVKRTKDIPDQWNWVIITTIYKFK